MENNNNIIALDDAIYKILDDAHLVSENDKAIVLYYIEENLRNLLCRVDFDSKDVEIVRFNDALLINTIYAGDMRVSLSRTESGFVLTGTSLDKDVFKITKDNALITNHVVVLAEGNNFQNRKYEVDTESSSYTFSEGACSEALLVDDFDSTIKIAPLNARYGNKEFFDITMVKPATNQSKSLLRRLCASLYSPIGISTHSRYGEYFKNDLEGSKQDLESIFGRLRAEVKKNSNKKRVLNEA